jgi:hypothetical protein
MFLSVVQHFPIPGEIPDDPCRSFPDGFSLAAQIRANSAFSHKVVREIQCLVYRQSANDGLLG